MRRAVTLRLLLVAALLGALALPAAATAEPISIKEARGQIKTATETWAALLDGKAHIGRCERTQPTAVRCTVVIRSADTRCEMRVSVSRSSRWDSVRARGLRCARRT
jgi:hypothetical protein